MAYMIFFVMSLVTFLLLEQVAQKQHCQPKVNARGILFFVKLYESIPFWNKTKQILSFTADITKLSNHSYNNDIILCCHALASTQIDHILHLAQVEESQFYC